MVSGRPTQFASKTGVGTTGRFLCSNEAKTADRMFRMFYVSDEFRHGAALWLPGLRVRLGLRVDPLHDIVITNIV